VAFFVISRFFRLFPAGWLPTPGLAPANAAQSTAAQPGLSFFTVQMNKKGILA
jgi:hypothetical protein